MYHHMPGKCTWVQIVEIFLRIDRPQILNQAGETWWLSCDACVCGNGYQALHRWLSAWVKCSMTDIASDKSAVCVCLLCSSVLPVPFSSQICLPVLLSHHLGYLTCGGSTYSSSVGQPSWSPHSSPLSSSASRSVWPRRVWFMPEVGATYT